MEPSSEMAQELTAVKEEEPLDGTLIAEAPVNEDNNDAAAENGNDEHQIVAPGTIIAQEAESAADTNEDYMNVKEENQVAEAADAENADYQEDSESSKEEDCPIVEVGTIIAQGNQEDDGAEAAASQGRTVEEQQDFHPKRRHSPDSYDNSKRFRDNNWEEADSGRYRSFGDYDKADPNKVLNLQNSWLKTAEEVKKSLDKEAWRTQRADGCFDFLEMNFSKTKMTTESLREVVKFCKKCPDLRVLKLFQNELDDEACRELVSVFKECTGLEELHLSHNWITERGVEILAKAALDHLSSSFSRPFWLRVEHNKFSYAASFMDDLKYKFHPHICGREDKKKCTNRMCIKDCRMHIPFLVDDKGRGRSWSNWNNGHEDWSYSYPVPHRDYKDYASYKDYKAPRSRSRSIPRPIRLTERQMSPPKQRMRDRSPIDRREVYYQEPSYPAYSNRRVRDETIYHPPPRLPSPPVRSRKMQMHQSPPRAPGRWATSGRRNRQTPMEPRQPSKQAAKQPAPGPGRTGPVRTAPVRAPPVRRPPSPPPPKPKTQQVQYALPAPLQAQVPPPQVDAEESEYSYDYYSDDYSYDDDEPQPAPGTMGNPPVVVPMMQMAREAPPAPIPSRAPKTRPPPRQPPPARTREAPRARARQGAEQHLVNRYEALNAGRDRPERPERPMRQAARRRAA